MFLGLVLDEANTDQKSQKISETALKSFVGGGTTEKIRASHGTKPITVQLSMKLIMAANASKVFVASQKMFFRAFYFCSQTFLKTIQVARHVSGVQYVGS